MAESTNEKTDNPNLFEVPIKFDLGGSVSSEIEIPLATSTCIRNSEHSFEIPIAIVADIYNRKNKKRKNDFDSSTTLATNTVQRTELSTIFCSSNFASSPSDAAPLLDIPIAENYSGHVEAHDAFAVNSRSRISRTQPCLEVSDLGAPNCECPYCGALFWKHEAVKSTIHRNLPDFSRCCKKGLIRLPPPRKMPSFLASLLDTHANHESKKFKENIRIYNAMFAFTSMGGKIDYEINKKPGPHIFRLCGQNHHIIGSLLPLENEKPKFSQLYVYDTKSEIQNRMSYFSESNTIKTINQNIVQNLLHMFDTYNEIAKSFRMARDRFEENAFLPLKLKLIGQRFNDGKQYEYPTSSEIAGLLVGDFGFHDQNRDIVSSIKVDF